MFERECRLYEFLHGYALRLVGDIAEEQFADQPTPGVNHPAWLLGHLALSTDFALKSLGHPTCLPRVWLKNFGPGSIPCQDRSTYPSKADLVAAYEAGHARVDTAARAADAVAMSRIHDVDLARFKEVLPTVGDLVAHLMTTHEAAHLGHLSSWRRQTGLPYLF